VEIVEQKLSNIPLWKKYDIIVLLHKNGTKVTQHAKDFDIPTTMLTTTFTNKDKIIYFLISLYTKT